MNLYQKLIKMTTKLDQLKTLLTAKEVLTETQMNHLKGGDGEDLRRNNP